MVRAGDLIPWSEDVRLLLRFESGLGFICGVAGAEIESELEVGEPLSMIMDSVFHNSVGSMVLLNTSSGENSEIGDGNWKDESSRS